MSIVRALVSLLGEADSDRLLEVIAVLLPRGSAAEIAVLKPPRSEMGLALIRDVPDGMRLVVSPSQLPAECDEGSASRRFVWCRDDEEAAAVSPNGGEVIVGETVDALAWELVRRLTGDLRQGAGSDVAPNGATRVLAQEPTPALAEGAATTLVARRPGRVPATPAWARARGQSQSKAQPDVVPRSIASPISAPSSAAAPPDERPASAVLHDSGPALASPFAMLSRAMLLPPGDSTGSDSDVVGASTSSHRLERRPVNEAGLVPVIGRLLRNVRRGPQEGADEIAELGQQLIRAHCTVVAVGTPKGGPGKTTEAAAIAVLGARAVEPHGGSAVLIDANLNNPDAWRQLAVPTGATTVREVVDALNRGLTPPSGEFARDERLRVLPEWRSAGSAYSAAEIDRLEQHLRLAHTLVVIDLPNSLPSFAEGPKEALVAHWLRHADVVVLPLDLGEASFIAVGETLDAIDTVVASSRSTSRRPGVVVPVMVPPGGERALRLPQIAVLLDHLRDAGADIVEVPYAVEVQTASHRRRSLIGASARADRAFLRVLAAVVAARSHGLSKTRV